MTVPAVPITKPCATLFRALINARGENKIQMNRNVVFTAHHLINFIYTSSYIMCRPKIVSYAIMYSVEPSCKFVDFYSFSSDASPAHNAGGRVLPLFTQRIFPTKEVEGFFWMLCSRQTRLLALRSSLCSPIASSFNVTYMQIK